MPQGLRIGLWSLLIGVFVAASGGSATASPDADSIGVVDPDQGYWYLRDAATGSTTSFYFGNPGDQPFFGDWDCDGDFTTADLILAMRRGRGATAAVDMHGSMRPAVVDAIFGG